MQMERRFRRRLLCVLAFLMILTSLGTANAQTRTGHFVQKRSLSSTTSALPEGLASSVRSVTEASTDEQRLEYVVYLAQNALGKPCRAEANPPESFGCNDLALYCYGLAGFDVASALENTAAWLPYSDLQRGDLPALTSIPPTIIPATVPASTLVTAILFTPPPARVG